MHWPAVMLGLGLLLAQLTGCAWFEPAALPEVPIPDRPWLAILPFGMEVEVTSLASIKTVSKTVPDAPAPEDEPRLVEEAVQEALREARWLLHSRLATGQQFRLVPLEETDRVVAELGWRPGTYPTPEQLAHCKRSLGADLVLAGNILDYGAVRYTWLAAGMFADITAETLIIGLASSWNPTIILANVGFELLTSTPLWFGGGYLFGVAFRPVRVEARVIETEHGEPLWQMQEEAIYARERLKLFPEEARGKKENQLYVNLSTAMEELADGLSEQGLTGPFICARQNCPAGEKTSGEDRGR